MIVTMTSLFGHSVAQPMGYRFFFYENSMQSPTILVIFDPSQNSFEQKSLFGWLCNSQCAPKVRSCNVCEIVKIIKNAKEDFFKKGSLDLIPSPSPSVKIQFMGGKVCLRCKGKPLLGVVNKLFVFKSFALFPHINFPAHNFH